MGAKIDIGGKDNVAPLLDAINRRLDTMEGKMTKVASTSRRVDEAQTSAFGPQQVSQLKTYIGQVIGASSAVAAVAVALRDMQQAGREAVNEFRGAAPGRAALSEVAGAFEGGLPEAIALSGQMQRGGGLTQDRGDALVFSLASTRGGEALRESEFFTEAVGRGGIRNAETLVPHMAAIRSAFGRRHTFEQTSDVLMAAAGQNPAFAAVLAPSIARASQLGQAGLSPQEVSAAVATLAETAGADVAGTQVRAIASTMLTTPEMRGMSLAQVAERFGAAGIDERQQMFPESRALAGIGTLSLDTAGLRAFTAEIAGSEGLSRRIAARPAADPALEAEYRLRQAEAGRRTEIEPTAIRTMERQRVIRNMEAAISSRDSDDVEFMNFAVRRAGNVADLFGLSPEATQRLLDLSAAASRDSGSPPIPDPNNFGQQMVGELRDLNRRQGGLQPALEN